MKDTTSSSSSLARHARASSSIYGAAKKRSSFNNHNGVSKHKSPSAALSNLHNQCSSSSNTISNRNPLKRSPRSAKAALQQAYQRSRDAQIAALRSQGILLEEEYRDEIRQYMHEMECETSSSTSCMDQQPEIKWHMRPCLVDFLVEVHFSFRLRPETLYLTLNIIDRYVSRRIVFVRHYQLVGCAALWIAAKFEDAKERVPTVQELVQVCRDTYDESAFIQMEGHVLSTIQWTLGHPTAEAWLRVMTCGPCMEESKVQHVARFLMELTLFYREFIKYPPSTIALASLTLARALCGNPRRSWEETQECLEVVEHLDNRLAKHVDELSETVVKKYSYAFYSKAATFVVQHYLQGGRFVRQQGSPAQQTPVTPTRSPSSLSMASTASTPMSSVGSVSDMSDDVLMTPITPPAAVSNDQMMMITSFDSDDKENLPTSAEPIISKPRVDVPEAFLPHEFVLGRPALNSLNHNISSSPRMVAVSTGTAAAAIAHVS